MESRKFYSRRDPNDSDSDVENIYHTNDSEDEEILIRNVNVSESLQCISM